MTTIPLLGITMQALFGQLLVGLINGSFYALLSLGLAIIFGLLNVVNFTHGVQYMMGAFCAYFLLHQFGIGYWGALVIAPLLVGLSGIVIEQVFLKRTYKLDHLYGLVLTFGLALIIEGLFREWFGAAGLPYGIPPSLAGTFNLGFMFLPIYRGWVILASLIICFGTWYAIERTRLGANLRAATENPAIVQAFGIDVPRMVMLTYGGSVALAALAGVMAAPILQVSPHMGSNLMIIVFAVVVIGGMGSILGAIIAGFSLGLIEGLTKVFYPAASNTVIFVIMAIVLLWRPSGLLGRPLGVTINTFLQDVSSVARSRYFVHIGGALLAAAVVAPFFFYSLFLMKAYCFALFALAFALLAGRAGLLSFGHAAYFGSASYITGYAMKAWLVTPEIGILLGTGFAAVLGLVFGWLAIRRHGIYFAMVTLALSQMVYFAALQMPFTGGEDGLQGVPRGYLFGLIDLEKPLVMYYFVLVVFLFGFFVIYRTIHSPFGLLIKAASQNEPRVVSLGYRTELVRLLVFVISASVAGLAGSTKALVVKLASLADVHWSMSGEVLLMALIGGAGTLLGPILGAFVVTGLGDYLATTGAWVTIIQGVIFVGCVLTFRRGIVGTIDDWVRRRR
jgi:branched-chain amino acid transport system permease protein